MSTPKQEGRMDPSAEDLPGTHLAPVGDVEMVLLLGFNREPACPNAKGPCPQLVYDQSIKMPEVNGWA